VKYMPCCASSRYFGMPTLWRLSEGNTGCTAIASCTGIRSETPCLYASTLFGNREVPRLSAEERTADRVGKSKDVRR